jgi:hypothetical protein
LIPCLSAMNCASASGSCTSAKSALPATRRVERLEEVWLDR